MLTRRDVIAHSLGALAGGLIPATAGGRAAFAQDQPAPNRPNGGFSYEHVLEQARQLAATPFDDDFQPLPDPIADLSRSQYVSIRYRPEAALWRGEGLPFQLQLFHRGFIYERPVAINIVEGGAVRKVSYSAGLFEFGADVPREGLDGDIGFSGFRIHAPINVDTYYDEVAVFQGGNAFRAIGKGLVYGLSARSAMVNVATGEGEDVPFFRSLWIEKPAANATELTVYGLLDCESLTGACKYVVRPGESTTIDVHGNFFIRKDLKKLGIGPLVSMYLYGEDGRRRLDDPRPEIHDSDGLLMRTGAGEWIWRPLVNPRRLAISSFGHDRLAGFGLVQRDREFRSYEDLDALFQQRPSAWVQPAGEWGPGRVELVEVPADAEIYDNIICFWVPAEPVRAGQSWTFDYRVAFGRSPMEPPRLGKVVSTRTGRGSDQEGRRFVIDFSGGGLADVRDVASIAPEISVSQGQVRNVLRQRNAFIGGIRLTFDFIPDGDASELRAVLVHAGKQLSEIWSYQWRA